MSNGTLPSEQYYERHLPHWIPQETAVFITWRLAGSLPANYDVRGKEPDGHRFVHVDRILDSARAGPLWLKQPLIAALVVDAIRYCETERNFYRVLGFVVMPNHVRLLIGSLTVPLARVTKVLKGYTARRANEVLRRSGRTFWQNESFDHWVRSPHELNKIITYIENNPVAARLVARPEDWVWSSAHSRCFVEHPAQQRTDRNVCPTITGSVDHTS